MKKFLSLIFAVCLIVPSLFMLTACGDGFETGKKYTLTKVEIVWGSNEEKLEILGEQTEQEMIDNYNDGTYITFNEDGSVSGGVPADEEGEDDFTFSYYYTKDGKSIKLYTDEDKESEAGILEVKGNSLIQKYTISNYATYVILTYSK